MQFRPETTPNRVARARLHWCVLALSMLNICPSMPVSIVRGAEPSTGASPSSEMKAVIAAILGHDAQISSVQTEYDVNLGPVEDKPVYKMSGQWLAQDGKELLTTKAGPADAEHISVFDGKSVRNLTAGGKSLVTVLPAKTAKFARKNYLPHGATARFVWEQELIPALEAGKATLNPKPVMEDGRPCREITGRMKTKEQDGADGMWFRLLLDPDHGYMPRYLEEYVLDAAGKPISRIIMDHYTLAEVSPGVWLPTKFRQRALVRDEKGELTNRTFNHISLGKLVVNQKIPDEQFDFRVAPGTQVADFALGSSATQPFVYVTGDAAVNDDVFATVGAEVETAKKLGPPTSIVAASPPAQDPDRPVSGGAARSRKGVLLLVGGGVVLVLGGVALAWRARGGAMGDAS